MPRRRRRTRKKRSVMKGGRCVWGANAPNNRRNSTLPVLTTRSCHHAGVQPPCCDGTELNENTRAEGLANWRDNRGRFCHFNEQIIQSYWNEQCDDWFKHPSAANQDRFEADANACKGPAMWEAGKFVKGMRRENQAYHDKEKEAAAFCRQERFQDAADAYAAAETMRNEWMKEYFREPGGPCKTCDKDCNNHEYAAKTCATLSGDNRAVVVRANKSGLAAFVVVKEQAEQGEEDEEDTQERQIRRELKQSKEAEEKKAAEEAAAKARERVAEQSARRKAEQDAALAAAAAEITKAAQKEYKKQAREYLRKRKLKAKRAARSAAAGAATEAAEEKLELIVKAWKLAAEKGEEGVNPQNIQLLVEGDPLPRGAAVAMLRATDGDLIRAMQVLDDGGGDQGGGAGGYKKRRRTRKKRRRRRKTRRRRQRKSRRRTRRR